MRCLAREERAQVSGGGARLEVRDELRPFSALEHRAGDRRLHRFERCALGSVCESAKRWMSGAVAPRKVGADGNLAGHGQAGSRVGVAARAGFSLA